MCGYSKPSGHGVILYGEEGCREQYLQVNDSSARLCSSLCALHMRPMDPKAKTYNVATSLDILTHGSKDSESGFPLSRSNIPLRATSSWSSESAVADAHAKAEYTMRGFSGSAMTDASTGVVGKIDGGVCESTDEPVLSCGACWVFAAMGNVKSMSCDLWAFVRVSTGSRRGEGYVVHRGRKARTVRTSLPASVCVLGECVTSSEFRHLVHGICIIQHLPLTYVLSEIHFLKILRALSGEHGRWKLEHQTTTMWSVAPMRGANRLMGL